MSKIPQQTKITADTHPVTFDQIVMVLLTLDRATVQAIKTLVSKQFPTLVQGFPARVVLPEPLVGHKVLENSFCQLKSCGRHNRAIVKLIDILKEDPEIFLSLINDAIKEQIRRTFDDYIQISRTL